MEINHDGDAKIINANCQGSVRGGDFNNCNKGAVMRAHAAAAIVQVPPPSIRRRRTDNRSIISTLTMPTCLGCTEGDESTASISHRSDQSSTLFTDLYTKETPTAATTATTTVIGPSMLSPAAAPCCCDIAQTIDEDYEVNARTYPCDRRNKDRKQSSTFSSCTAEDMCERFFSFCDPFLIEFCDPFLTACVQCANASNTKTIISKQRAKTHKNKAAIENTKGRSNKRLHDTTTTAMYNDEHDRLLSVLRQLGINEHEMTQLLINESDSFQSISRASAAAAAANAAAARIAPHYSNRNNASNRGDDGNSPASNRIVEIGVGDGILMIPPTKSVSYPRCDPRSVDNDRPHQDPPGENATTAYMEVECFVDTSAKNKNTSNNNNNRRLLSPLSSKKVDNKTNNTFDDEVEDDDLGTVISCREIVPEQRFADKKTTLLSLDDNPSKLIRGKSYIVNADTFDLVTLPTDESTKTDNMTSLNESNNNTTNYVTKEDLVVKNTTAAIVKRKSLLSSIFSRKKSSKEEASTSKMSSSSEWREFTDDITGRKYYSNGVISAWENPAISKTISRSSSVGKLRNKETKKKKRSRSTPPKASTSTSKPKSSQPRRSTSSPPKQPSASSSPAYSTNYNTIVETNDDDDQTLVSKLTFIPDGNVEINNSYFSSMVKGYRLSTQSFQPPVQHPVSPTISNGATTTPKTRSSSINTVPSRKGCTVNAPIKAATHSILKKKTIPQVQQSKQMTDRVATYDQLATRSVIVEMGKSFKSENIQSSSNNSTKEAKAEERKTETNLSQCTAAVSTKMADEAKERPMDNSNIQSSAVGTYEHFQFVLSDSSGCQHTSTAIDRSNYNTNNMMIRLPFNPNTTFYDLRRELMEDYPNEISRILPNDFKFTVGSANGLPISYMQEQKWRVRDYYDLPIQVGNGSYRNPYRVFIKSNHIKTKANEITQQDYDGCW